MKRQILIEKYIEPSEIIIDGNYIIKRWFNEYGDKHSVLGHPAVTLYDSNGQIYYQDWYEKGLKHRNKTLPSVIGYNSNEQTSYEIWYKKGIKIKEENY
jgi:hypothetical protein